MQKLFFDMDGVLVDFQSGIDKLSEETNDICMYSRVCVCVCSLYIK